MSELREPANPILEVQALKKYYPGVKAVDGIDFTVKENSCTGILGPNGAGKTTTIEIIEGINTKMRETSSTRENHLTINSRTRSAFNSRRPLYNSL